jgi:kumamolisin
MDKGDKRKSIASRPQKQSRSPGEGERAADRLPIGPQPVKPPAIDPQPKLDPQQKRSEIMNERPDVVSLPDSERHVLPGARVVGDADGEEKIDVTIYVRPRAFVPPGALQQAQELPPQLRTYATAQQMKDIFGADQADLDKVDQWATTQGLHVEEKNASARSVKVSGTTRDISKAFGVELKLNEHPAGRYRGRTGPIYIPRDLQGIVEAVFGLDNRKVGRPYVRKAHPIPSHGAKRQQPFVAPQLASLYNFPAAFDGSGQCVGILVLNGQLASTGIEAAGGYDRAGVKLYFDSLKIPMPEIVDVVVHGPGNKPGDGTDRNDVTGEVLLDIQVAGTLAPRAKFVMYFTEFTERGWVDAVVAAVTDSTNNPSVLSISYGNPEDADGISLWTRAAIRKVNEAFRQAALRGLTICCASGDDGSSDQVQDNRAHVDFPASSPAVLGCGGTRLEVTRTGTSETVWNDGPGSAGGGGVSTLFPLPSYQQSVNPPRSANTGHRIGRVVPDVSGLADPETGLLIVGPSGGFEGPIGGTSATAPMWAALIARLNQAMGKPVGFLNSILYKFMPSGVLRDITSGDNGAYSATPGFDACTGLGSPNGAALLSALQAIGGRGVQNVAPVPPTIVTLSESKSENGAQGDVAGRLAEIERQLSTDSLERQAMMTMLSTIASALHRTGIC